MFMSIALYWARSEISAATGSALTGRFAPCVSLDCVAVDISGMPVTVVSGTKVYESIEITMTVKSPLVENLLNYAVKIKSDKKESSSDISIVLRWKIKLNLFDAIIRVIAQIGTRSKL